MQDVRAHPRERLRRLDYLASDSEKIADEERIVLVFPADGKKFASGGVRSCFT